MQFGQKKEQTSEKTKLFHLEKRLVKNHSINEPLKRKIMPRRPLQTNDFDRVLLLGFWKKKKSLFFQFWLFFLLLFAEYLFGEQAFSLEH